VQGPSSCYLEIWNGFYRGWWLARGRLL